MDALAALGFLDLSYANEALKGASFLLRILTKSITIVEQFGHVVQWYPV